MNPDPVLDRLRAAGCVFAEDEARLLREAAGAAGGPERIGTLDGLVARRVAGEPLEYVLGWAEFGGLRIAVEPGVFVPRRRTELLVREAVALAPESAVVVELCCGTAAVAAAVGAARPDVELHAAELDPMAARCARRNLGPRGAVYLGDLYDAVPGSLRGRVDILVANAPYVPTAAIALMPPEARRYEPRMALDGGSDGLDVQRRVVAAAPRWLAPGGRLLVETSRAQADRTQQLAERAGLAARIVHDPDRDATALVATRR